VRERKRGREGERESEGVEKGRGGGESGENNFVFFKFGVLHQKMSISSTFYVHSFCTHGAQKHKKDSQVANLFTHLGSARAKAVRKYVSEIDPRRCLSNNDLQNLISFQGPFHPMYSRRWPSAFSKLVMSDLILHYLQYIEET